jgi:hypothetical protein
MQPVFAASIVRDFTAKNVGFVATLFESLEVEGGFAGSVGFNAISQQACPFQFRVRLSKEAEWAD